MVDIASFRFDDPLDGFQKGYDTINALRQDRATKQAGNALQSGDYKAAAGALYGEGMLDAGQELERRHTQNEASARKAEDEQRAALWKHTSDVADRLYGIYGQSKDVNATLQAFDSLAPSFVQLGETPEEIATVRAQLAENPDLTLRALGAAAKRELQFFQTDGAILVGDKGTGKVSEAHKLPGKPQMFGDYLYLPEDAQAGDAPTPADAQAPDAPISTASPTDDVFAALIQQESGGRPGVLGPQTRYGQAVGMTQMLPQTAQSMARKLGVPWRPDLLRGTSPEAAEYQQTLGRAYFDEGLQRYGGDVQKALMYYHGGPNERLWGPKTQSYAEQVLARVGGEGASTIQGGSGEDTVAPQIPGFRAVGRVKGGEGWRSDGKGFLVNDKGDVKADPRASKAPDASKQFTQEQQLRTQMGNRPEVKDFASVRPHIQTIGAIAKKVQTGERVTAADDMALIFAYMKMLDPGSVVREGEFANAQNTAGLPQQVVNLYNRVLNGTRLSDKQRTEFFQTATTVMDNFTGNYTDVTNRYRGMAQSYGLDADRVAPAAPAAPAKPAANKATEGFSPAQTATAQRLAKNPEFKRVVHGTKIRPYVPRNEAEFKSIKDGQWYVDDDGQVYQKGR